MKKCVVMMALTLLASTVWAELPAEKREELAAAGLSAKPAKGDGPVFSKLAKPKAGPVGQARQGGTAEVALATVTLQYDDGNLTSLPTVFGQIYGNIFNKANNGGPIAGTFALNSFQFYFMEANTADTDLFFQPSDPLNATMITARASINFTGLANSGPSFSAPVLNTVVQAGFGTTGIFNSTLYLGGWCLNANATFPVDNETLGLATNTFGGVFRGFTASSGAGAQAFAAQSFNAILRANVTGANVPVELMAFGVD